MATLAFLPHLMWMLLLRATLTVLVPHFLGSLPEIESNNPGGVFPGQQTLLDSTSDSSDHHPAPGMFSPGLCRLALRLL